MLLRNCYLLITLMFASVANADTIAIIGTGDVGKALGTELALQGHTIIYGSRSPLGLKALDLAEQTDGNASTAKPLQASNDADIIVLAVPGMVVKDVVRTLGDLSGKIVIDVTNPLQMDAPLQFSYGVKTSNGEIVQALAPDALVVKAFNTISWQSMMRPEDTDGPLYVPVVGNSETAKEVVADFVHKMGLVPIDLGPIEVAHWTEFGAVVQLNNQFSERTSYDLVFRERE